MPTGHKMKMMKVFDYLDMPSDVQEKFRELFAENHCNGSHVGVAINHCKPEYKIEGTQMVEDWLVSQGADGGGPDTEGETVLVEFSW